MWYVNVMGINDSLRVIESFILTMWYVNTSIRLDSNLYDKSFILTMWYVNLFSLVILNLSYLPVLY